MSNLYTVVERLSVGDTILWKSTAEERETTYSTVDAIIETADRIEIRVSGPRGGQYTLDFPDDKHPNTHRHPPDESKKEHADADHQVRRNEVYVGRGPLIMLSLVGRAEDTPESMADERVQDALD